MKSVDDLQREVNLGTHSKRKLMNIGQYHYHLSPYKHSFYEADLCDVLGTNKNDTKMKKVNDSYIWLLVLINSQTKMLYFWAQKSKKAEETSQSLLSLSLIHI